MKRHETASWWKGTSSWKGRTDSCLAAINSALRLLSRIASSLKHDPVATILPSRNAPPALLSMYCCYITACSSFLSPTLFYHHLSIFCISHVVCFTNICFWKMFVLISKTWNSSWLFLNWTNYSGACSIIHHTVVIVEKTLLVLWLLALSLNA